MPEHVVVSPSTGSLAAMPSAGVSWVVPPNGMSTVAAPMVESNLSARPLLDATLRSLTSETIFCAKVSPAHS